MSDRLAPANATPLQATLDATLGARLGGLPTPIAEAGRPDVAPDAVVPFLAWGRSADLWRVGWPKDRKRAMARDGLALERAAGTLAGVRAHAAFAGARILDAVTPPAAFFAAGAGDETDALWRAWLARLPEIRLYALRDPALECGYVTSTGGDDELLTPGAFLSAENGEATWFAGVPAEAPERATLTRFGVEREIGWLRRRDTRYGRRGDVVEFFWPGSAGAGLYCDDAASADLYADGAPAALDHVAVSYGYGQDLEESWNLVAPTMRVQDVTPVTGTIVDEDRVGLYADEVWDGYFVDEIDPVRATYRSFRVMETVADWFRPASFTDFDRLGLPLFTAELVTELAGVAPPAALIAGAGFADDGHALPEVDLADLDFLCEAVVTGKALRDVCLIDLDIQTRRSLRARSFSDLELR